MMQTGSCHSLTITLRIAGILHRLIIFSNFTTHCYDNSPGFANRKEGIEA